MSKNKCGLKHYLKIFPKNKKFIQHLNTKLQMYKQIKISKNEKFINLKKFF